MHQYPDVDSDYFALPQWQRDLVWALAGPALLNTSWAPAKLPIPGLFPACSATTDAIGFDPAMLNAVQGLPVPEECRSPRLGLVFEHLWQHWLAQGPLRWHANLQIKDQGRTLGELDLLVDDGHQHWHLELAVKFYLSCEKDWIGPNRRDRLADKIRHTRDHQLTLSRQQAAIDCLQASNWHPSKRLAITRGCLFYPHERDDCTTSSNDLSQPVEVNPEHWRGRWIHAKHLDRLPQGHWYLLAKDQWLSPALVTQPVDNSYVFLYLTAHFKHVRTPVCLVRTEPGRYGWAEQGRWFVMPDGWPSAMK